MTTNGNSYRHEEHGKHNRNDGNTSDDSLLLMADDTDDRTPLLDNTNNVSAIREEILVDRSITTSAHCHVPDDRFDFGSRNRLISVLLICILFMGIETAGMFSGEK